MAALAALAAPTERRQLLGTSRLPADQHSVFYFSSLPQTPSFSPSHPACHSALVCSASSRSVYSSPNLLYARSPTHHNGRWVAAAEQLTLCVEHLLLRLPHPLRPHALDDNGQGRRSRALGQHLGRSGPSYRHRFGNHIQLCWCDEEWQSGNLGQRPGQPHYAVLGGVHVSCPGHFHFLVVCTC